MIAHNRGIDSLVWVCDFSHLSYLITTFKVCMSARSVKVGVPPTVVQANGALGLLMGATATTSAREAAGLDLDHCHARCRTHRIVDGGRVARHGTGTAQRSVDEFAVGRAVQRSGVGSGLCSLSKLNVWTTTSCAVSMTTTSLSKRSATQRYFHVASACRRHRGSRHPG